MSEVRLIDANALKEEIIKWFNLTEVHNQYWWNRVKTIIDNAPTVEEKSYAMGYQDGLEDGLNDIRPQGEWIEQVVRGDKVPCCSNCGLGSGTLYEFDFCPNCGADMRGEKNGRI